MMTNSQQYVRASKINVCLHVRTYYMQLLCLYIVLESCRVEVI